ncbi:MAG: alpha/beta fold hydrolase [Gammaproteobacteria bacterium]|nr:alpha/beta fold hydrolase [Gammaproteobacteria bacterium]
MQGPDSKVTCLFVHGWAMNSSVWEPVVDKLPEWIDTQLIDLPGHGQRVNESLSNLQNLTEDLLQQCRHTKAQYPHGQPLYLIGWSLGGLPCIQLAMDHPEEISGLMLVSSNPCFVDKENWKYGIDAAIFEQFSQSLKKDFSGTIRRFLSLQVKGSESGRLVLRGLREKILQQSRPHELNLDAGLEILKQTDLRSQLKKIKLPVNWILGGQDGLVKKQLAEELDNVMVFNNAGHAAFLSHTDEFIEQLIKSLTCIHK